MEDLYLQGIKELRNGNQPAALECWEQAAENGSKDAILSLANIYRLGSKVDLKRAIYWAQEALKFDEEQAKKIIEKIVEKLNRAREDNDRNPFQGGGDYREWDASSQQVVETCMEWGDQAISDFVESYYD